MTAHLQPGDKIVLCAPGSVMGADHDQAIIDILTQTYAEIGVTVVFVAIGAADIPLSVVSVLRQPAVPRSAVPARYRGNPPWQKPETTEPLRAQWDPLAPKDLLQ